MIENIKVGILGCGVISRRTLPGLCHTLQKIGGRVSALCDVSDANVDQAAALCPDPAGVQRFSTEETFLSRGEIDAVIVATPIAMHAANVRRALQSGRHVYCHKTLAESAEACLGLGELADARALRLAASPGQTLLLAYARAIELVRVGEIGEIVSVDASAEATSHRYEPERRSENPPPNRPFSWEWYHRADTGGGPLDDMLVYPLAFLTELFDSPAHRAFIHSRLVVPEIDWQGRTVPADAPDSYAGLLLFGDVPVTVRASFSANATRVPWGFVSIRGARGTLEVEKCSDLQYRLYVTPNDGAARCEDYSVFSESEVAAIGCAECHVLVDMAELLHAVAEDRPVKGATAANAARIAATIELIKAEGSAT